LDTEALLVIELARAESAPNVDLLQSRFNLAIVKEPKASGGIKYIVQFARKADIGIFENELALWECDARYNTPYLTVS
jgi:hypothetical protein